jgi:hypothetical protein
VLSVIMLSVVAPFRACPFSKTYLILPLCENEE